MKLIILFMLLSSQVFAGSITINYPQREKKPAYEIHIVCNKVCVSGSRQLDSEFFKDKIGQIIQIEAKGDLPKSFQDKYIKKVTVIDGKHIVNFYMGDPLRYSGPEFQKFIDFNDIISEIEFLEKQGKAKE